MSNFANLRFILAGFLVFLGVARESTAVLTLPTGSPLPTGAHQPDGLTQLLFQSSLAHGDSKLALACFDSYISFSSEISNLYRSEYNKCMQDAIEARQRIDNEVLTERLQVIQMASNVCDRLQTCNSHKSSMDVFTCHASVGPNNTKITYALSGNATEFATLLQEEYRSVAVIQQQGLKAAERLFVERTANNFKHLKACLSGREKPRPLLPSSPPASNGSGNGNSTSKGTDGEASDGSDPVSGTELPPSPPELNTQVNQEQQYEQQLLN